MRGLKEWKLDPLRDTDPAGIGDFTLLARLGQGGMGRVYLAESRAGQRVALKVMLAISDDARRRERFGREVEMLRSAVGVSIANYADDGTMEDVPWLATEYVPGPTLERRVRDHGPLRGAALAMLGASLAEGLGHIHRAGLLHRDFKPPNVVLGPGGPKIIDFGLAVDSEGLGRFTATGMVAGTAAWMAPEQAAGERDLTPAIDIYALGAVMAYGANGKTPSPRATPSCAGLTPPLAAVVSGMLADEPRDRPTAPEVREAMLSIVGDDVAGTLRGLVSDTYGRYTTVDPPPVRPAPPAPPAPPASAEASGEPTVLADPTVLVPMPRTRHRPSQERAAKAAQLLRTAYAPSKEL